MFRPKNVTARDLELLSCSLDNALSVEERLEFKKRLAESPHLNTLLEEQSRLKRAMRALPSHKPPHNFTLTRAEAQKARRGRVLQPVFGWASAIAALVLMVVFGSEFIFSNFSAKQAQAPAAVQLMPMSEEFVQDNSEMSMDTQVASEKDSVNLLNWAPDFGGGGPVGMGGGGPDLAAGQMNQGVTLNINVVKLDESAPEISTTVYSAGEKEIAAEQEIYLEPEMIEGGLRPNTGGGGLILEEEPTSPEDQTTEAAPEEVEMEAPLILGINPEQMGKVIETNAAKDKPLEIKIAPEAEARAETEAPAQAPSSDRLISPLLKWGLLALTLILGVVWLVLKFRR